ncbi:uncharacterized protein LOC119832152 [Zerene cesonia]|uniref:uncharacterized protein LOC119832152 n=1 Tax=Zerene cesonia TaxID=33412 RepID=UPI0018E56629|nr:uncharacterized protein LOC119832152 [Zerene cesonia]
MWLWFLLGFAAVWTADGAGAGAARLACYVESARNSDFTECTHLVYAGTARGDKLDALLKDYRKHNPKLKIIVRVTNEDKDFKDILKSKYIQGLEVHDAHRTFNRTKVSELVGEARAAVSSANKGPLLLALPAHPELLAKYYDLRTLIKKADLMMVQTHGLGMVKKMTYHPSRLSGLWDMMNTDSVVDLVIGLGIPASKIVISLPATARQFKLQNETLSTPGSPTLEEEPREIDQAELCRQLQKGRWTLERDQDLSAPYAFKNTTWISFEDSSSVDVKGKYARVRGLAGLALFAADKDLETPCGNTLRSALHKVLNQQSRAPRAAVLRSLENEILQPGGGRALAALQLSPYRITQVVDADGVIHNIREDTRTEFACSRQGYFVHPRSCARFYRCVKFDQYSPDFTVFEFDCPAGLEFDERVEVCVWPGARAGAAACAGSAEVAPVPAARFRCPAAEGFYADPENCRWFFACLDHGTGAGALTAYEFRCPFGLGFDAARRRCDWPWLVPACRALARYEAEAFGFSDALLTAATGFQGRTADSVNIAAHQSLLSGASLDNLVGLQTGFLSKNDALDNNFISSQELENANYDVDYSALGSQGEYSGISYNVVAADAINKGLVQATNYKDEDKYTSGSLILDDYRLPNKATGKYVPIGNSGRYDSGKYQVKAKYQGSNTGGRFQSGAYRKDYSGAYVHNPAGDRAKPYEHRDVPPVPYEHKVAQYAVNTNFDRGTYSGTYDTGSYNQDATKSSGYDYPKPSVQFNEGLYQGNGYTNDAGTTSAQSTSTFHGSYGGGEANYVGDDKVYPGAAHTLTAGAVNVDLVGKTTLVDESNYGPQYSQSAYQQATGISQSGVTITHVGTDNQNLDGFSYLTTPTSSGVPTTATPFAATTSLPATYKTTYVPEAPRTSIKQIFGYTQPAVTYVQPTVVAVTPSVDVSGYKESSYQNTGYSTFSAGTTKSASTGYDYSKPSINFEEGISYSTPATVTVTKLRPQSFSHNQQTLHRQSSFDYSSATPVTEEPFKKVVAYTTGEPVSYVQPTAQSFSQQTIHKVESGNVFNQAVDNGERYINTAVYETSTPQPIASVETQSQFGQQTVHTVDAHNVNAHSESQSGYEYTRPSGITVSQSTGYEYRQPSVQYETQKVVQYSTPSTFTYSTTAAPSVSTARTVYENPLLKYTVKVTPATFQQTYVPQVFRQQNINRGTGYRYQSTAQPIVSVQPTASTYQVYNTQNSQGTYESGYEYSQPSVTGTVSTVAPVVVSSERSQAYSQQTIHRGSGRTNFGSGYEYKSSAQPVIAVRPADTYQSQEYNQQSESGYEYSQPAVAFKETVSTAAPIVVSTERPQAYSQQTINRGSARSNYQYQSTAQTTASNYEAQAYEQNGQANYESGYEYSQPSITLKETIPTVSTVAPVLVSTERSQSFGQQTVHRVEQDKILSPRVEFSYQKPTVTVFENPLLKYTQKATLTDVRPTVLTQNIKEDIRQPIQYQTGQQSFTQNVQYNQGYSYDQPEIQRNVEVSSAPAYSDASLVSHQAFHLSQGTANSEHTGNKAVFVSTTPANLVYEAHYSEYETPRQESTFKSDYNVQRGQEYYRVSTTASPLYEQRETVSQSSVDIPSRVESVHFSSVPSTQFKQSRYESPEIQVAYKAEEYLPPVVSTSAPVVTSTFRPRTYSTTSREYLPPSTEGYTAPEYLPPAKSTYLPPRTEKVATLEYLPPTQESRVTYDNYNYKAGSKSDGFDYQQSYSVSSEVPVSTTSAPVTRKQNIVVETAKSQLLGFGAVGPDAGLVSTFSTARPTISTAGNYLVRDEVSSTATPEVVEVTPAPRRSRPKYFRPVVTSTTEAPVYVESTSYQAPEYLPPDNNQKQNIFNYNSESSQIKYNPYQSTENIVSVSSTSSYGRKQNIVVETAKSNLLGFGTVGPDAGLISPATYTTSAPIDVSSTVGVTSTYVPIRQQLVEVTSARAPLRRTKPKVAVVTKINDFNPLLVRKLGAVCSCQSPVLVLKGRRPTVQTQIIDDYSDDDANRGDIDDGYRPRTSYRASTTPGINTVTTAAPIASSTFNPIIVPDDSYYQDYPEASNDNIVITPTGRGHSENYVSSTPVVSTTERVTRIRPRVKSVTIAPTYKTVILNQEVAPEAETLETVNVQTQTFDRYGPGGLRSRDETLQGSIDCKKAGLFRHPKQCNKFYACRWDCNKQRFTLHVFNCPVQLSFDPTLGACNWPSQGPACQADTLLTNTL